MKRERRKDLTNTDLRILGATPVLVICKVRKPISRQRRRPAIRGRRERRLRNEELEGSFGGHGKYILRR